MAQHFPAVAKLGVETGRRRNSTAVQVPGQPTMSVEAVQAWPRRAWWTAGVAALCWALSCCCAVVVLVGSEMSRVAVVPVVAVMVKEETEMWNRKQRTSSSAEADKDVASIDYVPGLVAWLAVAASWA